MAGISARGLTAAKIPAKAVTNVTNRFTVGERVINVRMKSVFMISPCAITRTHGLYRG